MIIASGIGMRRPWRARSDAARRPTDRDAGSTVAGIASMRVSRKSGPSGSSWNDRTMYSA